MSWKEFDFREDLVTDRLPWGGITHPNIMQNKDDSLFGIIEYTPYATGKTKIELPEFTNGWSLWIERQHTLGVNHDFLVVCWNPFIHRSGKVGNSLYHKNLDYRSSKNEFFEVLSAIAKNISQVTTCHILAYQEICDFLFFSLSLNISSVIMPDVPLYLDALLSQDISFDFKQNDILIDGKKLLVISLPAMADFSQMKILYQSIHNIPYRHVQRLLLFGDKQAAKEQQRYTSRWCTGRKSIRNMILNDVVKKINGYHMDVFVMMAPVDSYTDTRRYVENIIASLSLPYLVEEYNLKDVWWGSLAGIFRANVVPPLMGFDSIDELLVHTHDPDEMEGEG